MNELESNLRAHLQHVADLDIEVPERLQPTRILQRPGIHGIEPHALAQPKDLLFGAGVIAGNQQREPFPFHMPARHVLGEHSVSQAGLPLESENADLLPYQVFLVYRKGT
jgi:hypothetical protein